MVLAITEGLAVVTQVTAGTASRTESPARALRLIPTFLATGASLLGLVAVGFAVFSPQVLDLLKVPTEERPEIVGFALGTVAAAAAGLVPVTGGAVRTSSLLGVTNAVLVALSMAALHLVGDAGIYSVPLRALFASVVVGVAAAFALRRAGVEPPRWTMLREGIQMISSIAVPVGATFLLLSVVALGYLRVLRHAESSRESAHMAVMASNIASAHRATCHALVPRQQRGLRRRCRRCWRVRRSWLASRRRHSAFRRPLT